MQFELVVVSPEKFDQFLAAKVAGGSTQDAMGAIGFTGEQAFATTTEPFDSRRTDRGWNQSGVVAAGK
jgi:cytochrome c oxidase subunit 2